MRGESQTWSFDDPYDINQRDIHRGQKWKKENSKLRTLADKRGGKKVDFRVTRTHRRLEEVRSARLENVKENQDYKSARRHGIRRKKGFNLPHKLEIEAAIKVRNNARTLE